MIQVIKYLEIKFLSNCFFLNIHSLGFCYLCTDVMKLWINPYMHGEGGLALPPALFFAKII